ncbi:hypothetical protein [Streptomyces sp. NPDC005969]|uniref:hypothetical protein n=1 Tax=Streptomyces sp. NPDC005969 TaxID=3156722 RepID=UPI0033D70ACD
MFRIVEGEPDLMRVEDAALRALIARCLTKGIRQRPYIEQLLEDPVRPRPRAVRGAWLPAGIVAHLAQQSARLLDAEAAPLREGPVDLATVGLWPKNGPPEVVPAGNDTTTRRREQERRPRRRHRLIVLPVVAVIPSAAALRTYRPDRRGEP